MARRSLAGSRRTRSRIALAAVLALAASAAWQVRERRAEAARVAAHGAAQLATIERSVARIIEMPGISAAFALPDGRVGSAVTGFADVEAQTRMTPATRFLAGSVGKSLHAALAVELASEGVVDLDAPISRWLGREPWFARLPNARDLTLRLLLSHQSGLIDHVHSFAFLVRELKLRMFENDELIPTEELIGIALDREPKFRAGAGFAYGDTNYLIAGLVIQRATGRSPFDQIEDRFLRPLGLAGITPARSRRIARLAAGYQLPVNPLLLPPKMIDAGRLRIHPMLEGTAGGFAATPRDLVRWVKALFEPRGVPAQVGEEMTRHSVACGDGRRYGLGLFRYETPLGPAWGHGGYFPGYRSGLIYSPDAKIAVAVQTNRDVGVDVDALLREIAQRLVRELGSSR